MMNSSNNQPPAPSPQFPHLTRIVPWSHQLACEILRHGELAVDLTAGKGRDTLALAQAVGHSGQVVCFDVQQVALDQTCELLKKEGFATTLLRDGQPLPDSAGVYLVHSCHSKIADVVSRSAKAIIANLGYLPGGDQSLITKPASTLVALNQSLELLAPGGRLAVTVYPSHSGGSEEAKAVDTFFPSLCREQWQVLLLRTANRPEAPYLYVTEKSF
jgi:16S rRNA C1402 N4-methylase RsmH